MAAKKKTAALPRTIAKINATMCIKALENHILGKKELKASQVNACAILIRKVIPDLAAVQVEGQIETDIRIRWQK